MELIKDKVSGVYHAHFKTAKGTVSRSTGCTDRDAAKKVCADARIAELESAFLSKSLNASSIQAIMAGRKITCETALNEWAEWRGDNAKGNTLRTQLTSLKAFLRQTEMLKKPVTAIDEKVINSFVNQNDGTGKRNRALRLATVRSYFKLCVERGYCIGNPANLAKVKVTGLSHKQKESQPRLPITHHQFQHILKHTSGFWHAAVAISYWTGMRLSDVAALEWDSISSDRITVWTQKRDKRISLQLDHPMIGGGELATVLLNLMLDQADPTYVFPVERACVLDPDKRSRLSVQFGRLLESLAIENKSFHCLRHAFASRLKKSGVTIEDIGAMLGHSEKETTELYVHA